MVKHGTTLCLAWLSWQTDLTWKYHVQWLDLFQELDLFVNIDDPACLFNGMLKGYRNSPQTSKVDITLFHTQFHIILGLTKRTLPRCMKMFTFSFYINETCKFRVLLSSEWQEFRVLVRILNMEELNPLLICTGFLKYSFGHLFQTEIKIDFKTNWIFFPVQTGFLLPV